MNLRLNPDEENDRQEILAHFAERVASYEELGETHAQAEASARRKFGDPETTLRELRTRRFLALSRHPAVLSALVWAALACPLLWGVTLWMNRVEAVTPESLAGFAHLKTLIPYLIGVMLANSFVAATGCGAWIGRRETAQTNAVLGGILAAIVVLSPVRDPFTVGILFAAAVPGALIGRRVARFRAKTAQSR